MLNNKNARGRFNNATSKLEKYFNPLSAQTTPSANATPVKSTPTTPPTPPPRSNSLPPALGPLARMTSFATQPGKSLPDFTGQQARQLTQLKRQASIADNEAATSGQNVASVLERLQKAELNAQHAANAEPEGHESTA